LTINGQTFTVNQAAAACTYSLTSNTGSAAASGGTGSFTVNTTAGCAWTCTSSAAWLTGTPSGSGTGPVSWSATANTSTTARNATLTINGQVFTVTQSAAACTYSLTSNTGSAAASGG